MSGFVLTKPVRWVQNLRPRIGRATAASENTHEAQALGPLGGLSRATLGCPAHGQIRGDKHLTLSLKKINESGQQATFFMQFKPHCLAQSVDKRRRAGVVRTVPSLW
ncbi:MAG: hypothetical protein PHY54_12475 [Methylococcales bacterium]|nr:hypothetical protein [Methylococcales bacterium]